MADLRLMLNKGVGNYRARSKIENESFNVMKNHGYELEHNFGHGRKFLATTLLALNLLTFAWHTSHELLEPPRGAAREAAARRVTFFAHVLELTTYVVFPYWQFILESLVNFTIPPEFVKKPEQRSCDALFPTSRITGGANRSLNFWRPGKKCNLDPFPAIVEELRIVSPTPG